MKAKAHVSHIFIIAEAAACHDGSLEKAYRLIDLASEIGADACKFQWCSDPVKLTQRRHAPEYLDSYKLLSFPPIWHASLAKYCEGYGIEYMCTVYLAEDIPVIAPYVKRFKVASFECEDAEFTEALTRYNREVVISLGLNGDPKWGGPKHKYLHCVSAYPTPFEEISLSRVIYAHGLSDHTRHPLTGAFAVCAGAWIIEFHIRLDDTDPRNADYEVARTPEEARVYVENIRLAETMLGDGIQRVMPSEEKMLKYKVRP